MKIILISVALLLSLNANALIVNSPLEVRHQELIEQAVNERCGIYQELTHISYQESIVVVENGIHDLYFDIQLVTKDDQSPDQFNQFNISVKSVMSDMFDHSTGNWGAYSILDVTCTHM